jgi:hypothetical protein
MSTENVFNGLGIEVELNPNDFLKVVETLTRIGVVTRNKEDGQNRKLIQSCHILHKRGKYAILHFKELFLLDGKDADFSENDEMRRNTIARLLEEWELIKIVDKSQLEAGFVSLNKVRILPYSEKKNFVLESKYTIGKYGKKRVSEERPAI